MVKNESFKKEPVKNEVAKNEPVEYEPELKKNSIVSDQFDYIKACVLFKDHKI